MVLIPARDGGEIMSLRGWITSFLGLVLVTPIIAAAQPWPQRPEGTVTTDGAWRGTPPIQVWSFSHPGLPQRIRWQGAWMDVGSEYNVYQMAYFRIESCSGRSLGLPSPVLERIQGRPVHVWMERRGSGPCRFDRLRIFVWVVADGPEPDPRLLLPREVGRIWRLSFTRSGQARLKLEREVTYDETLEFLSPETGNAP
jgi:hypothetical protein